MRACLSRRRLFVPLCLAAAALLGCPNEELELQPCTKKADCWTYQSCVQTPQEKLAGLPGICTEDDSCLAGQQLGCECDFGCGLSSRPPPQGYPELVCDEPSNTCVVEPVEGGSTGDEEPGSSGEEE